MLSTTKRNIVNATNEILANDQKRLCKTIFQYTNITLLMAVVLLVISACSSAADDASGIAPTATNVSITDDSGGVLVVGTTLTGIYTYSDADNDPEGISKFRWLRGATPISAATTKTYTTTVDDSGQSITFEVTPVATQGTSPGAAATSDPVTIDNAPVASNVRISASAPFVTGTVLTGNYDYSDTNGDSEGATTFRWLRDDTPIVAATASASTYTLTDIDIGRSIRFRVNPIALTGTTLGSSVTSKAAINVNLIGEFGGGLPRATAIKGHYAYVAASSILSVIDIADPARPKQVGYYDVLDDGADNVAIDGNYAFLAVDLGLLILDISNPTTPTKVGLVETSSSARAVSIVANTAYVANRSGGLAIINIEDPTAPSGSLVIDTPDWAYDVAINGKYAYIADYRAGLRIIDLGASPMPVEVGFYQTPGIAQGIAVSGSHAYVADDTGGLRIIDISDATAPTEVGFIEVSTPNAGFRDVAVNGNYAYVTERGGLADLRIINVSDPTSPRETGVFETPGNSSSIEGVTVNGKYAYVANRDTGLHIVDISNSSAPTAVNAVNTTGYTYNIAVSGNYAYLAGNGLGIIDISNPTAPAQIGSLELPRNSTAVAINGNYAYVAGREDGLRVVDISNRTAPIQEGAVVTLGSGYAYDVAVNGNYAFVAGNDRGLLVIDISDPTTPAEVTTMDTPGNSYGVVIDGSYAYVADGVGVGGTTGGLHIIDISSPTSPQEVTSINTFSANDVAINGNHAYVAGASGLHIIDISNATTTAPVEVGQFTTLGYATSVAIYGSYAYVADDIGGLRVVDVSTPSSPIEVGMFHTPGSTFGVAASGSYAYVADSRFGLGIYEFVSP